MRRLALLMLLLSALGARAGEGIVSLNVCADQYLLALGTDQPIRSLSAFAADPALSWLHAVADSQPRNRGHGETLLADPPALVLAGRHDPRAKLALLARRHVPLAYITPWDSLAHGRGEIRQIAATIGRTAAGEALIDRIDAALARAKDAAPRPATVLRLHRRGYVAPARNLMTDIIAATGLIDLAVQEGLPGGVLPIETILRLRPDYLILTGESAGLADQGQAVLAHPALARLYPVDRRIVIPALPGVCEGPSTPDLIDAVAAAVRMTVR